MSWNLTNIAGSAASKAIAMPGKAIFQFPNVEITIQPGQSAEISTGYTISSLPPDTIMHTFPNPELINKGLLTFPKRIQAG